MTIRIARNPTDTTAHGRVHRATFPVLQAALLKLPEYRAAKERIERLGVVELAEPRTDAALLEEIADDVEASLDPGCELPDIIGKAAADVVARAAADHVRNALQLVQTRLGSALDQALQSNLPTIYRSLHTELEAVVQAARATGLTGPLTADEAIELGKVEQFKAIDQMVERHGQVRAAQSLCLDQLEGIRTNPEAAGPRAAERPPLEYLANPVDVWPDLVRAATGNPYTDPQDEEAYLRRPLPGGTPWPTSWMTEEALWWFVNHPDAKPWVPTPQQRDRAFRDWQQLRAGGAYRRKPSRGLDEHGAPRPSESTVLTTRGMQA